MAKTNGLSTRLRDLLYRGGTFTAPTEWWLAIYSANPGSDLQASPALLPRIEIDGWQDEGTDGCSNDSLISISNTTTATITVSHFSIHDAETGGNALHYGAFPLTFIINSGDTINIEAGRLKVRFR